MLFQHRRSESERLIIVGLQLRSSLLKPFLNHEEIEGINDPGKAVRMS